MKKYTTTFITILSLCFFSLSLNAQIDSIPPEDLQVNEQMIEDYILDNESDEGFDFNTIFEDLEQYRKKPLNINKATREDLSDMRLLTDLQIDDILQYRRKYGDLIDIHELQAIPSMDMPTIRLITEFVAIAGDPYSFKVSLPKMLYKGDNELYLRWGRILEEQKGYIPLEPGQTGSRYLGDPNSLYIRYQHKYENRLSFGFTGEKDRGEEFFKGSNPNGFDFYSAHFALKNYSKTVKDVVLGDFRVSMGQGLILYSGFGRGKSAQVLNIKRSGRTLAKYTSAQENSFMRGAGATIGIGKHVEFSAFGSYLKTDGNLIESEDNEELVNAISSLLIQGLHRTENEIADEKKIDQFTAGGVLKYKRENGHIALNGLYNKLSTPLLRTPRPYNKFYFNGDQLTNVSLDYSYIMQNFHFFGETAISDNGSIATVNGLLLALDKYANFAVLHRHFPKDYHALNPNAFSESNGVNNEDGIYVGFEFRPAKNWYFSAYFDAYRHPWLKFTADAPSRGYEYRARLTYYIKRKLTIYAEIRNEIKDRNAPDNETKIDFLVPTQLFQARLYLGQKVNKELELRSRLHVGFWDNGVDDIFTGYLLHQDIIYKPVGIPWQMSARLAVFNTDDYGIRFYAYENNLLNSFSIPPYYNKGTRYYLNLRYKGIRNLTLEARIAQTYWSNEDVFGSGLEEIQGNTRTEVAAQIKYKF